MQDLSYVVSVLKGYGVSYKGRKLFQKSPQKFLKKFRRYTRKVPLNWKKDLLKDVVYVLNNRKKGGVYEK